MIDLAGTPVRHHVDVDTTIERAFEVFTSMTVWWPPEHRLMEDELREVVIEPRVGGRCYQVGVDDAQCDWGRVLVWEPPRRLVVAWHLTSRFEFDPDAAARQRGGDRIRPDRRATQPRHVGAPVLRPPRPRRRCPPRGRRHAQRLVLDPRSLRRVPGAAMTTPAPAAEPVAPGAATIGRAAGPGRPGPAAGAPADVGLSWSAKSCLREHTRDSSGRTSWWLGPAAAVCDVTWNRTATGRVAGSGSARPCAGRPSSPRRSAAPSSRAS